MKKIIILIILTFTYSAMSQSLSVFDVEASNFPTIKAKFFAFAQDGKQITNLNPSDFEVKEDGQPRSVTKVSCPAPLPFQKVSVAMSIDISGSMAYSEFGEIPVELGKTTAKELCNLVTMPPSEFALQTCNNQSFIIQDFTTNKTKILSAIEPIKASGGNDFVEQLQNRLSGLLNVAKTGRNKRVAIIYTDAWWHPLTLQELQICKDTCNKYDITFYAVIYSRPEAEPNGIKKSLQELADFTGGYLYDGVTSATVAKDIGLILQQSAQGVEPCEIEWQSGIFCAKGITDVEIGLPIIQTTSTARYQSPNSSISNLEFIPKYVKFINPEIGIKVEEKVMVIAHNSNFIVTNIKSNNAAFEITPTSFTLYNGESIELTVSYFPVDSGFNYCTFDIENDVCPTEYYVSGGWKGKKPTIKTIKLIHPNGGEMLIAGSDTVITWEGVPPDEPVKLEYRIDDDEPWITIADSASGFSYNWRVPITPSNKCLARVTAKVVKSSLCDNPDVELCGNIWMGCNLDVEHYRNGDPIPEVSDPTQWANLKTGAWCYYNNNPLNGEIYGKLYNWYAVNDPRGLAPEGWHIPIGNEWWDLVFCFGGLEIAGGKLKSTGTIENGDGLWYSPNIGATNESRFSGVPGGLRVPEGYFSNIGNFGIWWSSTETSDEHAWIIKLNKDSSGISSGPINKILGFSVRCVKD